MNPRFVLLLAQGLGSGRIPFAPGTFGSLAGVAWFFLLLWPGCPWIFFGGVCISVAASVRICGVAEKILDQTDPGSVVLDEIIAVPLCFSGWAAALLWRRQFWPAPSYFLEDGRFWLVLGGFALFRLFDIAKPWPVRGSQRLPGGWGITADDVLAAGYVNLCFALACWLRPEWF